MIETIDDFEVVPGSAIVGRRISEINEQYNVRILQIYKDISEDAQKYSPPLDRQIMEQDYLRVHGEYKNLTKLLVDATTKISEEAKRPKQ